jgi:hypothetical protein
MVCWNAKATEITGSTDWSLRLTMAWEIMKFCRPKTEVLREDGS